MMAGGNSYIFGLQPAVRRRRRTRRVPEPVLRQVLEQAVIQVFAVPTCDVWAGTRGHPNVAFARQVAMYLAHVSCGLNLSDVGRLFGRDRTTVAHACSVIEDRRDEPGFDRALDLIEGIVRFLAAAPGEAV